MTDREAMLQAIQSFATSYNSGHVESVLSCYVVLIPQFFDELRRIAP